MLPRVVMDESLKADSIAATKATEDIELVRAVLRREGGALDRFAERMRFVPRVLTVRNARAGRPFDSGELEDLVQDTLVAIWRKLSTYDGRVRLEPWLFRFCFLEFLRSLRNRRTRHRPLPLDHAGTPELASRPARDEHAHEDLRLAMGELGAEESALLELKHFQDLTFEEIATRLEISSNTVKTRYYRALEKLRGVLAKRMRRSEKGQNP